mmetsp:Transcript_933/g.1908  ORF Transcript_933/g.1908 Transcript_933/m.1908 type:complete len:1373 (+) Transcript_933:193-4311(+)
MIDLMEEAASNTTTTTTTKTVTPETHSTTTTSSTTTVITMSGNNHNHQQQQQPQQQQQQDFKQAEEETTERYDEDHFQTEFGTLADQKDETHYDSRFSSRNNIHIHNNNKKKNVTTAEQDYEDDEDDDEEEDPHTHEGRIEFPQDRLYGRDTELETLRTVYQGFFANHSNNNNSRRVLFLAGPSGSGKSALMEFLVRQQLETNRHHNSNHHHIAKTTPTAVPPPPPTYASGKFQQLKGGNPFTALTQALNGLVKQLLQTYSTSQLHRLRQRMESADLLSKPRRPSSSQQQQQQHQPTDAAKTIIATLAPALEELISTLIGLPTTDSMKQQQRVSIRQSDGTTADTLEQDDNASKASSSLPSQSKSGGGSSTFDLNLIKYSFCRLLSVLATPDQPLIFFIDDVQWADAASLELLTAVVQEKTHLLDYVWLVCAYRSNEVTEELQAFCTKAQTLLNPPSQDDQDVGESKKEDTGDNNDGDDDENALCRTIELNNLSPNNVGEFIADCIQMNADQVQPITQAVYTKTLGNIFFVKQALEELVRKNVIYYDVICYQWQFSDSGISSVELENHLSDDVIQMVQGKLQTLEDNLQTALALAAYCDHSFDATLLGILLTSQDLKLNQTKILELLRQAFEEGLVLPDTTGLAPTTAILRRSSHDDQNGSDHQTNKIMAGKFKFAHDRIREAACQSVPEGDVRNHFLLRLAVVLVSKEFHNGHEESAEDDWMLFCATRHFNSIPREMTNNLRVAELNLQVGKIAVAKGSFADAVGFFESGVNRLDDSYWRDEKVYPLVLEMHNYFLESEDTLGHSERRDELIQVVLTNAKTSEDKLRAQFAYVEGKPEDNESVNAGLEVLKQYGIDIPEEPTDKQVRREQFNLRLALKGRKLWCLAKFPVADDREQFYAIVKIAQSVTRHGGYAKRSNVVFMLGYRIFRLALEKKKITLDLPAIIMYLGGPLRAKEDYKTAMLYANVGKRLIDRFPEENGKEFIKSKVALSAQLLPLWTPFRDIIETHLELNKLTRALGIVDISMAMAMVSMYSFLASSFPLGMLFEPKLMLFEESAKDVGKMMFVNIFRMLRQCLYNLQGEKNKASPEKRTDLTGAAFNEEMVLSNSKGPMKMMNGRDIASLRIFLAVIYNDEECMEAMLERLAPLPNHDIPVARQHMRLSFVAMASQILIQNHPEKREKWGEVADKSFAFVEQLAGFGSPNAAPVYRCLVALKKPSVSTFEDAMLATGNSGLMHLHAIINERYGIWLLAVKEGRIAATADDQPDKCTMFPVFKRKASKNSFQAQHPALDQIDPKEPLKLSMWCFQDWGATGKVERMQMDYPFLKGTWQEKPPSAMTNLRRVTAKLGVPSRSVPGSVSTSDNDRNSFMNN